VTCESGGEIYAVETGGYTIVGHFKVNVRPRSMAFLPGGDIGFIPSESTGELNVIDTVNLKVSKVITLPPGSRPMSVKTASDGAKIYVSNGRAGTVSVLDGRTYELLNTIKVGTRPWGIALSPDGKLLYSANGPSNDVSVVDLETHKEIARAKAGESPWSVTIVPAAH
jgi:YVTN family beta-propeller protein